MQEYSAVTGQIRRQGEFLFALAGRFPGGGTSWRRYAQSGTESHC